MHNNKLRQTIAAILGSATLTYGAATLADTDTTTADPVEVTDRGTSQGTVVTKLSAEFADFLGGQDEAAAVINDLRDGSYGEPVADGTPSPATEDPTAGGDTANTAAPTGTGGVVADTDTSTDGGTLADAGTGDTTSGGDLANSDATEAPRSTMGYGNIRITLKMAQAELGKLGITEPTQDELAAALNGGTIDGAELEGVLAMRAEGMGWGTIAKANGYTVGSLMGKGHAKPKPVHTGSGSDYIPSGASGAGIQSATGSGTARTKSKSKAQTASDYIPSGKPGKAYGQGMVSGLGGGGGGNAAAKGGGMKGGYKGGGVMVSAAGGGAGAATVAAASNKGGAGRGLAKGHSK